MADRGPGGFVLDRSTPMRSGAWATGMTRSHPDASTQDARRLPAPGNKARPALRDHAGFLVDLAATGAVRPGARR